LSQSDSFIDEVTEEVRRDRLFAMFRRYGWIAAVVVILIVGGAAWNEYRKSQDRARAETFGNALLSALEQSEAQERVTALDSIQAETPGAAAVRDLMKAAEASEAGDTSGAVDILTVVANNPDLPLIYRSLAQYRALALQGDTLSPADRRAAYEGLSAPGAPLRHLALEQIALTHVEEGDRDAALNALNSLLEEAGLSADLQRRVSQLIVSLGGSLDGASDEASSDGN